MKFLHRLVMLALSSASLLIAVAVLASPAWAAPPYHQNPEHRGRVPACETCHTSHQGYGANLTKVPVLDTVCANCHRASDIARWKTEEPAFLFGSQGDRIIDQLSRPSVSPFEIQGPATPAP